MSRMTTPGNAGPSRQGLWTVDECAAFLKEKPTTLKRWRYEKTGPAYIKYGNTIRYAPGMVMRWLDEHTTHHDDEGR